MPSITIRRSTPADIGEIMEIYEKARRYMRASGNTTQWVNGYPSRSLVADDIAAGISYVGVDAYGSIAMVFAFIIGDDPTYTVIKEGKWLDDEPYGTIHRLASDGRYRGILDHCVRFCFSHIDNLRLDTHADNAAMHAAAARLGFVRCGIINCADGTPRVAYQKHLPAGGRCGWAGDDPLYVRYHDEEWGRPVKDDRTLFEFLTLEGAQAGLAWITILRKREGYRRAFHDFDFRKVALMTPDDEERLRRDSGIVRNRLKIHSTIVNARLFGEIVDEFGSFFHYVRTFFPGGRRIVNDVPDMASVAVSSDVSDRMSADLRRRGFRFVGTTICYSFLQATGFIDDHLNSCPYKTLATDL